MTNPPGSRIFGDAVNPSLIPLDLVQGVCLYADGAYAASEETQRHFRDAGKAVAMITVIGDWRLASIADVENGDLQPQDAPLFIRNRNRFKPGSAIIYCNRSTLPEVEAQCAGLVYWRWVADWTGEPHDLPGVKRLAAVQYTDRGTWDETLWLRPHLHPTPAAEAA